MSISNAKTEIRKLLRFLAIIAETVNWGSFKKTAQIIESQCVRGAKAQLVAAVLVPALRCRSFEICCPIIVAHDPGPLYPPCPVTHFYDSTIITLSLNCGSYRMSCLELPACSGQSSMQPACRLKPDWTSLQQSKENKEIESVKSHPTKYSKHTCARFLCSSTVKVKSRNTESLTHREPEPPVLNRVVSSTVLVHHDLRRTGSLLHLVTGIVQEMPRAFVTIYQCISIPNLSVISRYQLKLLRASTRLCQQWHTSGWIYGLHDRS